jgi:hypothetical protein
MQCLSDVLNVISSRRLDFKVEYGHEFNLLNANANKCYILLKNDAIMILVIN